MHLLSLVLSALLAITPLGAMAAAAVAAPAMDTAQSRLPSCSWNRPGHNPFMGDVVAAVDRYPDIPATTRARLKARMAARQYDEIVSIRRDAVVGRARYGSEIRDMHFGTGQVCATVSRAQWTPANQERGLVYCEAGHCILVPTVCRNVSRIDRVGPAVAAGEPAPAEGTATGGGGGGGSGGVAAGVVAGAGAALSSAPAVSGEPVGPAAADHATPASFADGTAAGALTSPGLTGGGWPGGPGAVPNGSSQVSDGPWGQAGGRGSWAAAAGLSGPLTPAILADQVQISSASGATERPQVALNSPLPGEHLAHVNLPDPALAGAVPEPGSWALMLLGLLTLVAAARRRD